MTVEMKNWTERRENNFEETLQKERNKRENITFKEWAWQVITVYTYMIINVSAEKM